MRKILLPVLLILSIILASCGPTKLDEDFNVKIEGKVLNSYGKPLSSGTIQLWKSDMDLLDKDVYFYWLVENKYPFKTTEVDSNGQFEFLLTGKEANNALNTAAAYFVVSIESEKARTSTFSHVFSDNTMDGLYWKMLEKPIQLWTGGEVTATTDKKYIKSTWTTAPEPEGDMSILVADYWYQSEITNGSYLPTFVLDRNPSVDEYNVTIALRSPNYRYQVPFKKINTVNSYVEVKIDCDSDTNVCGGYNDSENKNDLAPVSQAVNDGKYGYFKTEDRFEFNKDLTPQILYLKVEQSGGLNQQISSIVFHGLNVNDWEEQTVTVSYIEGDIDQFSSLPGKSWTKVGSFKLTTDVYYYLDKLNISPRWLKIELSGKATFNFISEVSLFK